ncbi:PREDICTED: uncharacterized protein LOC18608286 [Theobroma cacao]|uniref:Uncharacterized protein LOC18608286 n=1 Tax=Theobroma cacao TaxID=3641 RepID=A0AB32VWM8_THECC|nr:PREDICTED: uncharacterized protein LOC18608286 [Theobroma cacao]
MQSGNDPSFTKARTGPQAPIDPAQPQTANEPAFMETTTGPEASISLAPSQTANERTYAEATTGPEASIGQAPPQTTNEPLLTQSRIVNVGAVTTRQLRQIIRKHEKDMLELKVSIQSLSVAMHTIEDRIVGWILDGLKSQQLFRLCFLDGFAGFGGQVVVV